MKIGILTFNRAHNCGAMLQCVALQMVLERMGHDVWAIDFNKIGEESFGKFKWSGYKSVRILIASLVYHIFSIGVYDLRIKRFVRFGETWLRRFRTQDNVLPNGFDGFVLGSDQVLNPDLIAGYEDSFLMESVHDSVRKISYAASIGYSSFPAQKRKRYAQALDRFDAISVRERGARKILETELMLKSPIHTVLDPTLLLEKEDYYRCECKISAPKRYVLVYSIGGADETLRRTALQIAKARGIGVVMVNACKRSKFKHWQDYLSVSPDRLLYLIHHSECVVTTSFHGLAFSLIYQKQFIIVLPDKSRVKSRLTDLLRELDCEYKCVGESENLKQSDLNERLKTDYIYINGRLSLLRNASLDYLNAALK